MLDRLKPIKTLKSFHYKWIIGVKPDGNKWLFDWVNAGGGQALVLKKGGYTYEFRWFNDAPLNESKLPFSGDITFHFTITI